MTPAPPGCLPCWRQRQLLSLLVPHVVMAWGEDTRRSTPLFRSPSAEDASGWGECGRGGGRDVEATRHLSYCSCYEMYICSSGDAGAQRQRRIIQIHSEGKKTVWLKSWLVPLWSLTLKSPLLMHLKMFLFLDFSSLCFETKSSVTLTKTYQTYLIIQITII